MITFSINNNCIEIIVKFLLSVLIGLLIGRERKRHDKAGGGRTMSLVCLSATMMTSLSLQLASQYVFDFVRLMAYGIAGIGFLGSGIIVHTKHQTEGLTTASTLLALLLVGFCIGLGYYFMAISASLFILVLLESKYLRRK